MRTTISEVQVSPTAEEAAALVEYLFDRLPMMLVTGLFERSSSRICGLRAYGVTHELFNYSKGGSNSRSVTRPKAFMFYDSGFVQAESGEQKQRSQQFRLFLLQDTSWLLVRTRKGSWDDEPSSPPTMHYRAADLLPVFREIGVQGTKATKCLNKLMRSLDAAFQWPERWLELNEDIQARFSDLV